MKRLGLFSALFLALVLTISIVACGGGGGGGAAAGYTGKTTQATVTTANADTVSSTSVKITTSVVLGVTSGLSLKPNGGGEALFDKPLSIASEALRATNSSTVNGSCGGSATISVTNNPDGTKSATVTFSSYCVNGNVIYNGTISVVGTSAAFTATIDLTGSDSTMTVSSWKMTLSVTNNGITYASSGTISEIIATKKSTGESIKIENFTQDFSKNNSTLNYSLSMSGKFYHSTSGYVTVSTSTPLTGNSTGKPSAGVLRVVGASSGAEVRCISSTSYELWVDASGGGTYTLEGTHAW